MHLAETSGLEVGEGLVDFLLGVHHERAVTDDRFVDRLAAEQQHHGVFAGFEGQLMAVTLEQRQLPFAHRLQAVDLHRTFQYHQRGVAAFVQIQRQQLAGVQAQVPDVDRGEGARRPFAAIELTSDQAQAGRRRP